MSRQPKVMRFNMGRFGAASGNVEGVRSVVRRSIMEQLSIANAKTIFHPIILGAWMYLSIAFMRLIDWLIRPNVVERPWVHFRSVITFTSVACLFIALIDMSNRPQFVRELQRALTAPDLDDITDYYSRSPSSGFWLLRHGKRFVGILAVDAASPEKTALNDVARRNQSTSTTATIRHFYIHSPYRNRKLEQDVLLIALRSTFRSSPIVQQIQIVDSPFASNIRDSIRWAGFQRQRAVKSVGVFRWRYAIYTLSRARFEAQFRQPKRQVWTNSIHTQPIAEAGCRVPLPFIITLVYVYLCT
ncbi:hypothetical protein HGRIS_007851 [Hohenbuehelia grisea]|uniref:N-acetyltransferase domain-containing protein n=1 Tax=Hohenbuehelia grisea TaxID=104357 RepID=A0ABR3J654_9AGAR